MPRESLHFGPYRQPKYRLGETVICAMRGPVKIVGVSDGRIQWPIGKTVRAKSLVLFGDLERAVKLESPTAIRYWWGVGSDLVWKWHKALNVRETQGTTILRQSYATPEKIAMLNAAASAVARKPERRARIAASRIGKARPPKIARFLRKAQLGVKQSSETRARRSATHKRLGTRPPKAGRSWETWEDRLLRKLPPTKVAKKTGRTLTAVFARRSLLKVPDGRRRRQT